MTQAPITIGSALMGIDDMHVEYWFSREGQPLQAGDPIVMLHHRTGAAVTARYPKHVNTSRWILRQILLPEGSACSANDRLALFTSNSVAAGASVGDSSEQASARDELFQYPRMTCTFTFIPASLARDLLFHHFPAFRLWYFRSYPLVPLLLALVVLALVVWLALQTMHVGGTVFSAVFQHTPSEAWLADMEATITRVGLVVLVLAADRWLSPWYLRWRDRHRAARRG